MWRCYALILVWGQIFWSSYASAANLSPDFRDTRWLGRGNTGVAAITDSTAIFYNPAGLAFNKSVQLSIVNPSFAANKNTVNSYATLQDATQSDDALSDRFSPFLSKPMHLGLNVFPSIAFPHVAFGLYDNFALEAEYNNPVDPRLNFNYINDWGLAAGGGVRILKNLSFGLSMRYVRREAMDATLSGGLLLSSLADLKDTLRRSGEGWALNTGLQYRLPIKESQYLSFGLSVENLGQTTFRNRAGTTADPEKQDQSLNVGFAHGFESAVLDTQLLLDFRGIDQPITISKKIFTGAEVSLLKMDWRAGLYQGYWTAGVSLRLLPFIDLDFSSYGEELYNTVGQKENRVYLVSIRSGLAISTEAKAGRRRQKFSLDDIK